MDGSAHLHSRDPQDAGKQLLTLLQKPFSEQVWLAVNPHTLRSSNNPPACGCLAVLCFGHFTSNHHRHCHRVLDLATISPSYLRPKVKTR